MRVDSRVLAALTAVVIFLSGCAVRTETSHVVGGGDDWLSPSVLLAMPGAIKDIVVLVGLLISAISVFFNFRWGPRVRAYKAAIENGPVVIFAAINAKLEVALRATGPTSIAAAHDLVDCVQLYLGSMLDFTTDLGKPYGQLRKALTGKVKKPDSPTVKVDHDRPAGPAAAAAAAAAAGGGAAASVTVAGTHVAVETPPSPPAPPVPPTERDASTQEQIVEVRLALEAFARVWTRASIEQKLRLAQQSLLITKAICVPNNVEDPCAPETNASLRGGKKRKQ